MMSPTHSSDIPYAYLRNKSVFNRRSPEIAGRMQVQIPSRLRRGAN